MQNVKDIFKNAKKPQDLESMRKKQSNGQYNYNTSYRLSHDQIQAAALLQISEELNTSLEQVARDYFIDGVHVPPIISLDLSSMKAFFGTSIDNAVKAAKQGKPAFLSVDDGKHFVLAALVPDPNNHNKISVVYANSMPASVLEYQDNDKIKTGQDFTKALLQYIDTHKSEFGIELAQQEVLDVSVDQQYDECCGLSVALNMNNIAHHIATRKEVVDIKLRALNTDVKPRYYKFLGQEIYMALNLDFDKLDFSKPYKLFLCQIKDQILDTATTNIKGRLDDFDKEAKSKEVGEKPGVERSEVNAIYEKAHKDLEIILLQQLRSGEFDQKKADEEWNKKLAAADTEVSMLKNKANSVLMREKAGAAQLEESVREEREDDKFDPYDLALKALNSQGGNLDWELGVDIVENLIRGYRDRIFDPDKNKLAPILYKIKSKMGNETPDFIQYYLDEIETDKMRNNSDSGRHDASKSLKDRVEKYNKGLSQILNEVFKMKDEKVQNFINLGLDQASAAKKFKEAYYKIASQIGAKYSGHDKEEFNPEVAAGICKRELQMAEKEIQQLIIKNKAISLLHKMESDIRKIQQDELRAANQHEVGDLEVVKRYLEGGLSMAKKNANTLIKNHLSAGGEFGKELEDQIRSAYRKEIQKCIHACEKKIQKTPQANDVLIAKIMKFLEAMREAMRAYIEPSKGK